MLATINACIALGAKIEIGEDTIKIRGIESFDLKEDVVLDCGESGTTLRLLIPICTLFNRNIKIIGKESLFVRPLGAYQRLFSDNNATFIKNKDSIIIGGKLDNFKRPIDGSMSSQFVSGLLFILALKPYDTTLKIRHLKSRPYVNLTIETLKSYGVRAIYNEYLRRIKVFGNQTYRPAIVESSADYSHAANFLVLKALTGAKITLSGLDPLSMQGDKIIIRLIDYYFKNLPIHKGNSLKDRLKINKNIVFDVKDYPDLGPILMVLLTHSGGYLKNFRRLIYKESNRVLSMIEEMRKFGAVLKEKGNRLYIPKYNGETLSGDIDPHNDHRILMAMVMMALIYNQEAIVNDYEVVDKSYPAFFNDLEKIGVKLIRHD